MVGAPGIVAAALRLRRRAGTLRPVLVGLAKRLVGRAVREAASRSFRLRRALRPVGMRTRQAWYGGFVGEVELFGGRTARLGAFDENYLTFELFWKGWQYYEPLTIVAIHHLLRGAGTFLDVGGNVGYFSLSAASWYPRLRVVAFEPNPKLNRILRDNVGRNGLDVRVEQLAVSDRRGQQTFFLPRSDMSGTLDPSFNETVESSIVVSTTTLDDFVPTLAPATPIVIKIDVEGHEEAALRGARATIERFRPDILLEVTSDYPEAAAQLRAAGYRFFVITEHGLDPVERLETPRRDDILYLNVLATPRGDDDLRGTSAAIRTESRGLDLRSSSLLRPPATAG